MGCSIINPSYGFLEIHEQFGKDSKHSVYADESYMLSSQAKDKFWSNDRYMRAHCVKARD